MDRQNMNRSSEVAFSAVSKPQPSKKKLWKKLVAVIGVFSVMGIVVLSITLAVSRFRQQQFIPVPAPLMQNSMPQPRLTSVEFVGVNPRLPSAFVAYKSGETPLPMEAFAESVARALGMTKDPQAEFWSDESGQSSLVINPVFKSVMYLFSPEQSALGGKTATVSAKKLPEDDELNTAAVDFLKNLPLPYPPNRTSASFLYLKGEIEPREVARSEADSVYISYVPMIDEYPLYTNATSTAPYQVGVMANKTITRASISAQIPQPVEIGKVEPLSVEDALQNIRLEKGTVVSASVLETGIFQIKDFRSVRFETASIEYRYMSATGLFYPYYRFSGVAETIAGIQGKVEMVVPAYKPSTI